MIKHTLLAALLLPLTVLAGDCTNLPIIFENAYARTTDQDDETLMAYVTIKNNDMYPHTLTDVSTPAARLAVFQTYAKNSEDNDITLQPTSGEILIPAHESYSLDRDHRHMVFSGYKHRPDSGDTIALTFTFADGCIQTLTDVPVLDSDSE